jgi:hypothetical protein
MGIIYFYRHFIIIHYLHKIHEVNTYREGRVRPFACPHISFPKQLNGFGLNLALAGCRIKYCWANLILVH